MRNRFVCVLLLTAVFACPAQAQEKPAPDVALANEIRYTDRSFTDLPGNGFLLDTGDEVLAVTCKHVFWENRPAGMSTVCLAGRLAEWRMVVRGDPSRYVVLGELVNANAAEPIGERNTDRDYLVFRVRENRSGVKPLKLSPRRVQPGDTLTKVGWTFRTKNEAPRIREAVALGYRGPALLVQGRVPENEAGLSGSPVLDARGELVGIVSSWQFDDASGQWREAPCSTDYLWEVLYGEWLRKNGQSKGVSSFQKFSAHYAKRNGARPEVSAYLWTDLFFGDWLQARHLGCSPGSFARWAAEMKKKCGVDVEADGWRKSRLVFGEWQGRHLAGDAGLEQLEKALSDGGLGRPGFIDFCEFAQALTAAGKHDQALALLSYAAEKTSHMGQVYAFLGDAWLARGDLGKAKEAYEKCLQTYPGYPPAFLGLEKIAARTE